MQQDPTKSYYSEGWNLACTWYAPGAAHDRTSVFNQHCQDIGVAPFDIPCPEETVQAFSGFVHGWGYLDENMRFQRTNGWQLSTAVLSKCLEKAMQLYPAISLWPDPYRWLAYAPRLVNSPEDSAGWNLSLLLAWVTDHQDRDGLAIMEMERDTSQVGHQVEIQSGLEPLQVFANIYLVGETEPIVRIYRVEMTYAEEGEDSGERYVEDEHVLAGLALRDSLTELAQGLPSMLKYPSHLEEAQHTIYGTVLTLLLDRGVPKELADPVREFLATFHQQLEHRQKVETWQYNQYWFAAPVEHAQAHRERLDQQHSGKPFHVLSEDDEQDKPLINTVAMGNSEGEALQKLYELRPDLR